jgi:pSer/pThr/pTyr-binding forkhead associated (FHA) protein
VEVTKNRQSSLYELRPKKSHAKINGGVFGKGRLLLGRNESCDLVVNHDAISAVHAVLEILENKAMLYDMNSTNGTFLNGDRIIAKEVHIGDVFRLADIEFEFSTYVASEALPPVLDALEPEKGQASIIPPFIPELPSKPSESRTLPSSAPSVSQHITPSVVYPLASDPKAEFSEYIFEDKDELYPIFKYESARQAVEVIILFKDQIFSIDYLPEGKSTYHITGVLSASEELEFPYLGKKEKFPFVDVSGNQAIVHTLPGFSTLLLSDRKKDTGHVGVSVELSGSDLVRFHKDSLQIFVRNVSAPPKVLAAPILKRDPEFRKYLFLFLSFVLMFSVGLNLIGPPVEEKKDELAPERLATILYRETLAVSKNKSVAKTETAPKVIQKSPNKIQTKKDIPKVEQPTIEKPDVITTKSQDNKPDPGSKSATEKKLVKQGTEPVRDVNQMAKPIATTIKTSNSSSRIAKSKGPTAYAANPSNAIGHVEVYKSADFSSSVSSMVAKGGSLSGVKTQSASGGGGDFVGASSGVSSGSGDIKTAGIATNQGSLVGATTGVLGTSKGAEGLSAKKAIYTAGIPSETVVLGSMDPDIIRRILLEHLPQFRYCYQKELERTAKETSGVIKLNFTIGASGHVAQAGLDGNSGLPVEVKKCVVGVLKGIAFPEPMGGGTVEVKQPMNFYPKRI